MKKTNSLWPAIGAYIANNFISGLIHAWHFDEWTE
jgi:hypothetical protein